MKLRQTVILFVALAFCSASFGQKGMVNKGALIVVANNGIINLQGAGADYNNLSAGATNGRISLAGKIYIDGNWYNNAAGDAVFLSPGSAGEVIFNGATTQQIGGTLSTSFGKLTLSNALGLSLANDISLAGNLTLTSGNLNIGSRVLTFAADASISGTPSATSMIIASGTGEVRKLFNGTGAFIFPVGDSTGTAEYSPATLDFTSGTFGTGAYASVKLTNGKHPFNTSANNYLSRYWTISQNNISNFSCNLSLNYTDADISGNEGTIFLGKWNSPFWKKLNLAASTSNTLTGTVTSFGDFTGGESNAFDVSFTMGNTGAINEGAENGARIDVTLFNDYFQSALNSANWIMTNLPEGVTIGSVNRIDNTHAYILLSGSRTRHYSADITNATLTIGYQELTNLGSGSVSSGSGITFTAYTGTATVAMSAGGNIVEGAENGRNITLTLSNGTFASPLVPGNFTIANLPTGVTIGSVVRNSPGQVTITLSGNRTVDYDADIYNATLTVYQAALDNYTLGNITEATGITFKANLEQLTATASALTETNLDGAVILLALVNESFADASLSAASFTLNNAPAGTTVKSVTETDSTHASLTLAFDSANYDFDTDINAFSITVAPAELNGVASVTSNALSISAVIESPSVNMGNPGLIETSLNGSNLTLNLSQERFKDAATLSASVFTLNNAPPGLTIGNVQKISSYAAKITLSFDGTYFASDYPLFSVSMDGSVLRGGATLVSNAAVITAVLAGSPSVAISADSLVETSLDGSVIQVALSNDKFSTGLLSPSQFMLNHAPVGLTIGSVVYADSVHASITLAFDKTDFDQSVTDFAILVDASALASGTQLISNNLIIKAIQEQMVATAPALTETNLNGAVISLALVNESFADTSLLPANFSLNNAPAGTTVKSVVATDATHASLTLAFDSANYDFDTDIHNFSITVAPAELVGHGSVTSNALDVTAVVESSAASMGDPGLVESMLNGANLTLSLSQDRIKDAAALSGAVFTLNNAPPGLSIGNVQKISPYAVTITLTFDGAYFASDYPLFSVSIDGSVLRGGTTLVTNSSVITAVQAGLRAAQISADSLLETSLNGSVIQVVLSNDKFSTNALSPALFFLNHAPAGLSVGSVGYADSVHASLTLAFDGTDFDQSIADFSVNIGGSILASGSLLTSNNLTIIAVVEPKSFVISHSGLSKSNLNGAKIRLDLSGVTFGSANLLPSEFTLNHAPYGVNVDSVRYESPTVAWVILGYDGTNFTSDVADFSITINSSALSEAGDLTSNALAILATGVDKLSADLILKIYANRNVVCIQCDQYDQLEGTFAVYNLSGQEIVRKKLIKTNLNAATLYGPPGAYIVRIYNHNRVYTGKVFVMTY